MVRRLSRPHWQWNLGRDRPNKKTGSIRAEDPIFNKHPVGCSELQSTGNLWLTLSEVGAHPALKLFEIEGLGEVLIHPGAEGVLFSIGGAEGRDHDHIDA
jgi:hypothetical protein